MRLIRSFFPSLPPVVIALGLVSFFTDFSSEMIYPLLPTFLALHFGAGPAVLGLIEGIAETTASVLKVVFGAWADRVKHKKAFVVAGYGIAGCVRPLIGLSTNWGMVLCLRFADRVGKGIRTAPRDVILAAAVPPQRHGTAFGFHRMMDHAGALTGPLVAAGLLSFFGFSLTHVFLFAAVPAVVVMMILFWGVHEPSLPNPSSVPVSDSDHGQDRLQQGSIFHSLGTPYFLLLASVTLFTLGNSSDAFILLLLAKLGINPGAIAVLWSAHHGVKMMSNYIGGSLSDRVGRKRLILAGWLLYALVYLAFAWVSTAVGAIAVFLVYGLYYGLTEPTEKALVTSLVPAEHRGKALGLYHAAVGLAALPASIVFGGLWDYYGQGVAFGAGAALALSAALMLTAVRDPFHTRTSVHN